MIDWCRAITEQESILVVCLGDPPLPLLSPRAQSKRDANAQQYWFFFRVCWSFSALSDENNTIVVHADGLGDGVLTYVQVIAPGGVGLQHTSVLQRRDSAKCSFEYYAPVPFFCNYEVGLFKCRWEYLLYQECHLYWSELDVLKNWPQLPLWAAFETRSSSSRILEKGFTSVFRC